MRRAAEALNRGEFSVSHDLARRLTEGAPEFEDGWMMLTEALAGDERYQEGMQAIDDALAVHPGSVPLRIQRCKFLLGLGQRSECLEQVRSLVTEAGENAWALDQLAMYNKTLQSKHVAITNGLKHFVWKFDGKDYEQLKEFPGF